MRATAALFRGRKRGDRGLVRLALTHEEGIQTLKKKKKARLSFIYFNSREKKRQQRST